MKGSEHYGYGNQKREDGMPYASPAKQKRIKRALREVGKGFGVMGSTIIDPVKKVYKKGKEVVKKVIKKATED